MPFDFSASKKSSQTFLPVFQNGFDCLLAKSKATHVKHTSLAMCSPLLCSVFWVNQEGVHENLSTTRSAFASLTVLYFFISNSHIPGNV